MSKKLVQEDINKFEENLKLVEKAEKEVQSASRCINNRVHYILETIMKIYSAGKLKYWYWDGAEEGKAGTPDIDRFDIATYHEPTGEWLCEIDGEEWDLNDSFPKKWLFEDFEEELKNGRKLANKKYVQKEEEKIDLVKRAKKKLTKEELDAILNEK